MQISDIYSHLHGCKALVTGGLGFIGSSLARQLVQMGAEVTLVDSLIPQYGGNLFNVADFREKVKINISDVRDPFSMQYLVRGQKYLFNLAGQTSHIDSMTDPKTDLEINAAAQLSILEACRHHNPSIKIIFASTRQIYGRPEYLPVDEAHPLRPVDINGVNKLAGESYHLLYSKVHSIRACALRLTNTYGPGMRIRDDRQTFLGIWITRLLRDLPIQVFGDGCQLRDFNFVNDVVSALLMAAVSPLTDGQIYNLGGQETIGLADLGRMMVEIYGRGRFELVPFPPERQRIDIGDYYSCYRKFQSQLGWKPAVSLREGLKASLEYYTKNHHHYLGEGL